MADEMLPPIVTELLLNNDEFLAKLQESRDAMAAATEEMDKSSSVIQSGAGAGGAEGAAKDEEVKAEETAASSDLASMEEGALAGAAAQGKLGKAAEDTEEKVTSSSSKMADSSSKGGKLLEKASKGAALGILAVGAASVDVAIKLEQNEAALATALKNTDEGTLAQHRAAIEKTENAMVKYGKTPGETVRALAILTTASKSLSTATNDVGIAADYAARKHTSLEAAASMLAKVYSGTPGRAIKELGINLPQGSGKLASMEAAEQSVEAEKRAKKLQETELEAEAKEGKITPGERQEKEAIATEKLQRAEEKLQKDREAIPGVFKAISKTVEGEAAKQSKTLAGQAAVLKAEADQIAGVWGKDLLPYLKDAAVDVGAFVGWLQKGSIPAKALEVAFVGIAAALAASYAIKKVWNLGKDIAEMGKWVAARLGMGAAADTSAGMVTAADGEIAAASEKGAAAQDTSFLSMTAGWLANAGEATASAATSVAAWLGIGTASETGGAMALTGGAMTAAGIALATGGLILLVVGIVELVKHWKEVWSTIENVLSAAVGFIKAHIMLIVAVIFLPITVLLEVYKHWKEIWSWFSGAVSGAWGTITGAVRSGVDSVVGFFESLPSKVMGVLKGMILDMEHFGGDLIKALLHGIEHAPGDIAKALLKAVPGGGTIEKLGGDVKSLGKSLGIPFMAAGGIVRKPTLLIAGDEGDEAILPLKGILTQGDGVKALQGAPGSVPMPMSTASNGGLHVNNLVVNGAQKPNAQIVTELYRALRPMLQGA